MCFNEYISIEVITETNNISNENPKNNIWINSRRNKSVRFYITLIHILIKWNRYSHLQGPDFDEMSSFFPCEIYDAIQYINLGHGAQSPKIVIL